MPGAPGAGVGSAIGFLRAPFSFEANRSVYMRLSTFDAGRVRELLAELEEEATQFVRSCDANAPIVAEFKVYMRYSGQGWEIPVSLTKAQAQAPDADTYQRLFEAGYEKLFGRTVGGMDVEVTVWAVNATTPRQPVDPTSAGPLAQQVRAASRRPLFDPALSRQVDAGVIARDSLASGQGLAGPAVITEDETTIIVPSSRVAIRQPDGCIDLIPRPTGAA
ncbi:MAG: hypothetical protein R3E68_10485 [Burkholderiaceae bacterium]